MTSLREHSAEFLDYLEGWAAARPDLPLSEIIAEAGGAANVGIFCVDVINGFCHEGPLASPRVAGIIAPIAKLFTQAAEAGITNFVLTHDAHDPDAAEFRDYPPHCVRDTRQSDIVPELMALPFAAQFHLIPKNSIASDAGTTLDNWLEQRPEHYASNCCRRLRRPLRVSDGNASESPRQCRKFDLPRDTSR